MNHYIVVGAGILGASTAYHLARRGVKVTIVDRNDSGQATDAAAGIVCPWLSQRRNKAWYRLAKGGAKYYPTLIECLKEDGEEETGYQRVGAISLHTDEKKLEKMRERVLKRREEAPEIGEITRLSKEETKALFPPLADEYFSLHVSGAARVNGRALREALLRAVKKRGAQFYDGEAELVSDQQQIKGVKVNDEFIEGDQVIVTAGAWAKELFSPLGLHFLVSPQKAQIVHLHVPEMNTNDWPVVMPPNNQYLLAFEDGRIVVGATHEDDVGFDLRVTAGGLEEVLTKALTVAPGLKESTVVETRVGFRPFTPGFLPVFGHAPNYKNLIVANGLGASGLTAGPYVGLEIAKLALGEETELNPSDYDIAQAFE
ncbi:FAD-dependent oxidoreductase [Bacillus sp. FJAT-47783]|uniref:NAD(P)/FAD-dependent oxidoreductase n=1 Tax=Bacillus sp. FJAT-47783 TaxID=2922712 RepID=UPI001FAC3611|nr:FAD-dependent oxidoreductase [Bacillus sp. FJAT-47783]